MTSLNEDTCLLNDPSEAAQLGLKSPDLAEASLLVEVDMLNGGPGLCEMVRFGRVACKSRRRVDDL